MKILAVGYFGWGNFGDELILEIFKKRIPSDFQLEVVKRAKKKPFFLLSSILKCDAVVFPGGSVFQDESSFLNLLFWVCVIFVAFLFGKKIFLLDMGFEIKRKISKKILKAALSLVQFISVRDNGSFLFLKELGIPAAISADSAVFAEIKKQGEKKFPPDKIAIILKRKNRKIEEVQKNFPHSKTSIFLSSEVNLEKLGQIFETYDIIVAEPYHAVLLAASSGMPFYAVCYSQKIEKLLEEIGVPENKFGYSGKPARAADFVSKWRMVNAFAFQRFLDLLK